MRQGPDPSSPGDQLAPCENILTWLATVAVTVLAAKLKLAQSWSGDGLKDLTLRV